MNTLHDTSRFGNAAERFGAEPQPAPRTDSREHDADQTPCDWRKTQRDCWYELRNDLPDSIRDLYVVRFVTFDGSAERISWHCSCWFGSKLFNHISPDFPHQAVEALKESVHEAAAFAEFKRGKAVAS